jgi:hypothetical protein
MEELPKWKKSKDINVASLSSLIDFKATIAQEKQEILSGRPNKVRKLDGEVPQNKGIRLRFWSFRLLCRCSFESSKGQSASGTERGTMGFCHSKVCRLSWTRRCSQIVDRKQSCMTITTLAESSIETKRMTTSH